MITDPNDAAAVVLKAAGLPAADPFDAKEAFTRK